MLTERSSGQRWELMRGYVPKSKLARMVDQARWLRTQEASCLYNGRHSSIAAGRFFLRATTVHLKDSVRNGNNPTLDAYPEIESKIQDLLELYGRTSRDTSDSANVFSLLHYGFLGRVGWHRDEPRRATADDSLAVTLAGIGLATIRDESGLHRLVIPAGDALFLDNRGSPEERPLHTVTNIGTTPRTVLVD